MDIDQLRDNVRRAVKGDGRAASALFDEFHPRIYRYALSKLRSAQDADDVASETFARVLRDLGRFRWKAGGFEAWIFRIASNLVVDHVRHSSRERPGSDPLPERESLDPRPEELVLTGELVADLTSLLDRLVPDQREVLLLRFAAGLDTSETATVMGKKVNATRQLQFRAIQNLRALMAEKADAR
ncbi:MAG: sigma-70 family RNA polymerase sigma factor [Actinomycetota bacterium]